MLLVLLTKIPLNTKLQTAYINTKIGEVEHQLMEGIEYWVRVSAYNGHGYSDEGLDNTGGLNVSTAAQKPWKPNGFKMT